MRPVLVVVKCASIRTDRTIVFPAYARPRRSWLNKLVGDEDGSQSNGPVIDTIKWSEEKKWGTARDSEEYAMLAKLAIWITSVDKSAHNTLCCYGKVEWRGAGDTIKPITRPMK